MAAAVGEELPAITVTTQDTRQSKRTRQPKRPTHQRSVQHAQAAQSDQASTIPLSGIASGSSSAANLQPTAASEIRFTGEQFNARPASRPGELLEIVPGLIVTQHSGEGKANQYFLRGFNLDHGTDLAIKVDGMPVNMPTHGHGQGYADINFLIPELVGSVNVRKGPYFADQGDFASAGAVGIDYINRLPKNLAEVTLGQLWLSPGACRGIDGSR